MAYFRQPPSSGAEATIISKTITVNGTYNASSDSADGYDPVTVNVPGPVLGTKSISANGTYTASVDGYDGYSSVTVAVSGGQATITVSYDSSFYNKTMTCSDGITTYTETTTNAGSTVFSVNASGTWSISCDGVTRTVDVVLEYSTQMAITKTITVYSAASDTVSFTDVNGAKTVTTDTSGRGSVSITFIPPSASITFTSSVAKNPTNLSQAYSKTITMTDNITSIYVMPNNVLYWWGYINGSASTVNYHSAFTNLGKGTFNTNNISLSASNVAYQGDTFDAININSLSTIKMIANDDSTSDTVYDKSFTSTNASKYPFVCKSVDSDGYTRTDFGLLTNRTDYLMSSAYIDEKVLVYFSGHTSVTIKALWLE